MNSQVYVLNRSGNLNLVYLINSEGLIEDVRKKPMDKEIEMLKNDSVPFPIVHSKQVPDTIVDEYKYSGLDSLPELQSENFYTGPSGEALNIAPDSALTAQYIRISHDSSAPWMHVLINIDSNGNVTDYKLQDLCGNGIIYYDDTIHTKVYDQFGNEFWKLALKEIKKYPKWRPGYIGNKRVRVLHHIVVVLSKEKVGEDDN